MKISKKRWVEIALVALIAILIFTPLMSYVKRNLFPNNEIEISESQALNKESLSLELKGYNTQDIQLSDIEGKITFLHFWGTWCPDCRLEMPSVQAFYETHKDKIQFVLIDIERDGNYNKLTSYIEKEKYTVPMYEPISPMSVQLKVDYFPTTFIIDKEGNILSKHEGATDWNLPEVQQQILEFTE